MINPGLPIALSLFLLGCHGPDRGTELGLAVIEYDSDAVERLILDGHVVGNELRFLVGGQVASENLQSSDDQDLVAARIARVLLDAGAKPNESTANGDSLLQTALEHGR